MTAKKTSLLSIYAFSTTVSLALIIFAGFKTGLMGLLLVLMLVAREFFLCFDNAVANARILKSMSEAWS